MVEVLFEARQVAINGTDLTISSHLFRKLCGKAIETIVVKAPSDYSASMRSNFSICSWQNLKLLISMISGILDVSWMCIGCRNRMQGWESVR